MLHSKISGSITRLLRLSRCRDKSELLHHTELIIILPLFNDFAISEPANGNSSHCYLLAGRGNPLKLAVLCATSRVVVRRICPSE